MWPAFIDASSLSFQPMSGRFFASKVNLGFQGEGLGNLNEIRKRSGVALLL